MADANLKRAPRWETATVGDAGERIPRRLKQGRRRDEARAKMNPHAPPA